MLSARGLAKWYGGARVFEGVHFDLARGDILAITGPNGSGKSTLLRIIAGLETQTNGDVERSASDALGYAGPELGLYAHLTGAEHVSFVSALRSVAPDFGLLAYVGLSGAEHKRIGAYSTGMKSRLRLALALMGRPALLLLDEPGASLDAQGRRLVADIVREQAKQGAVLLATNDPEERLLADMELRLDA